MGEGEGTGDAGTRELQLFISPPWLWSLSQSMESRVHSKYSVKQGLRVGNQGERQLYIEPPPLPQGWGRYVQAPQASQEGALPVWGLQHAVNDFP